MGLTNKQKAVLHVAKTRLGLDDETYRDMLEAHGGARSAVDLNYAGFLTVMTHFEASGFVRASIPQHERKIKERSGMATGAQIRKIKAIWLSLAGSYYTRGQEWRALRAFLKKRFRVEHENVLTFAAAHKMIEAVKRIAGSAPSVAEASAIAEARADRMEGRGRERITS